MIYKIIYDIPGSDFAIFKHDFIINKFKNIHPNYISILGLISNFISLYYFEKKEIYKSFIFIIIRSMADCLDGIVARKYKKVSYIGGLLDTINDLTFCSIICYIIFKHYIKLNKNISFILSVISLIILITFMYKNGTISDHDGLKKKPNNIKDAIIYITIKHSFICHLLLIYIFMKTF